MQESKSVHIYSSKGMYFIFKHCSSLNVIIVMLNKDGIHTWDEDLGKVVM